MMLNELVIKGHVGHRHWSITATAAGGGSVSLLPPCGQKMELSGVGI